MIPIDVFKKLGTSRFLELIYLDRPMCMLDMDTYTGWVGK